MSKLSILVPSRGRPNNIVRLRDAMKDTCRAETELHVFVDSDDETADDYRAIDGITLTIDRPRRIGPLLNDVAPSIAESSSAIGFMGDDHIPRTTGWDTLFLCKLQDVGTGVVYGNDLLQGERLATSVVMSSDIVQTLGYFSLPGAVHLFLDNFWMSIGRGINRLFYFPDVIIEHLHPALSKSAWDETYVVANSSATWEADEKAYNEYMSSQYQLDIEVLKAELNIS